VFKRLNSAYVLVQFATAQAYFNTKVNLATTPVGHNEHDQLNCRCQKDAAANLEIHNDFI